VTTVNSRHVLVFVWAILVTVTIASWWLGHSTGAPFHVDQVITVGVLLVAAVKARLVIHYFMEVRGGPLWLKRTCDGWLTLLFLALFGFYWAVI